MKPLPPVRRTAGFEDGEVMITGVFAREVGFDLTEIYSWKMIMVRVLGCWDPSLGDDKAGCISAHWGNKRSIPGLASPILVMRAVEKIVRFDVVARAAKN